MRYAPRAIGSLPSHDATARRCSVSARFIGRPILAIADAPAFASACASGNARSRAFGAALQCCAEFCDETLGERARALQRSLAGRALRGLRFRSHRARLGRALRFALHVFRQRRIGGEMRINRQSFPHRDRMRPARWRQADASAAQDFPRASASGPSAPCRFEPSQRVAPLHTRA